MEKQTLPPVAGAAAGQAQAVVQAAQAWLAYPLSGEANSKRAFVRNRADEVLPLLGDDEAAVVYAVLVANYDSWDEDLRAEPLEVQAMVLHLLLTLERKLRVQEPVGARLAQPVRERARAITKQADALARKATAQLRQKAAGLRKAASQNAARGQSLVAQEQLRAAAQLEADAQQIAGDHPLLVEARQLRRKAAELQAEASQLRNLPRTMAAKVAEAIAFAIAPEASRLLDRTQYAAVLRLATPLSAEWRAFVASTLRFRTAAEALADSWAQIAQPSADIKAVLQKLEDRLFLRRMAGDPSLRATAPETVARALFPRTSPFSITAEMAMVRLAEELRRAIDAPTVDAQLLEKIEQLSAYAEATGDRAAVSKLHELQHKAALAELKAERRAAAAFARRKAAKQLRVRIARLHAQRV